MSIKREVESAAEDFKNAPQWYKDLPFESSDRVIERQTNSDTHVDVGSLAIKGELESVLKDIELLPDWYRELL